MNKVSIMKKGVGALLLALLATCGTASSVFAADSWQTPAIEGYGRIRPKPDAAVQPDKAKTYKVAFDVANSSKQKGQPNPGLNRVARAVNVFVSAGVPLDQLDFVAVIHGPATASVLNDKQYKQRFNTANPNLELIRKLTEAGVKVQVCGQALAENSYKDEWVDANVTVTLSALSDLAIYGNRGYSYQKM
ncbi:DsrE family protein [Pistricoccus aurantiacus]|uniref:DsrE family protein n=1 Tax=Pistricoccus aurantiacus TaxID=1883414 RepID=UPI001C96FEB5|nr:DsrE family protein [Pistricoccus aurantiacus]